MTTWIFLSTHFDDVVLSIGGLVWELTNLGDRVEIWTICAGDPPVGKPLPEYARLLHSFWNIGENVPIVRCIEDNACCEVLGVTTSRRYTVPDDIYRYILGTDEPVIKENEDQFKPLEPSESHIIPPVTDFIFKNLPANVNLVIPLAIGGHRDHVLTRTAAEKLGFPLWHYADYPYLVYGEHTLSDWLPTKFETFALTLSPSGLKAWKAGISCHRSQIPLLWIDEEDMLTSIDRYFNRGNGYTLWKF